MDKLEKYIVIQLLKNKNFNTETSTNNCIHLGAGLVAVVSMRDTYNKGTTMVHDNKQRETQDMARLMQRRLGKIGAGKNLL